MIHYHQLLTLSRQRGEWTTLMGPEELMAESVLLGGHGGVSGGANLAPRLYVDLYEAAAVADVERVRLLHAQVLSLGRIYRVAGGGSPYLRGLKCALELSGICTCALTEPFQPLAGPERERVRQIVEELANSQVAVHARPRTTAAPAL